MTYSFPVRIARPIDPGAGRIIWHPDYAVLRVTGAQVRRQYDEALSEPAIGDHGRDTRNVLRSCNEWVQHISSLGSIESLDSLGPARIAAHMPPRREPGAQQGTTTPDGPAALPFEDFTNGYVTDRFVSYGITFTGDPPLEYNVYPYCCTLLPSPD
jgi:hypothetical protein